MEGLADARHRGLTRKNADPVWHGGGAAISGIRSAPSQRIHGLKAGADRQCGRGTTSTGRVWRGAGFVVSVAAGRPRIVNRYLGYGGCAGEASGDALA